jgi:hypothetical protein
MEFEANILCFHSYFTLMGEFSAMDSLRILNVGTYFHQNISWLYSSDKMPADIT